MYKQYIIKTQNTLNTCMFSKKKIPKDVVCGRVITGSFYGKNQYRLVSPESMVLWLFKISGNKYLKQSVIKKIEQEQIAEEI